MGMCFLMAVDLRGVRITKGQREEEIGAMVGRLGQKSYRSRVEIACWAARWKRRKEDDHQKDRNPSSLGGELESLPHSPPLPQAVDRKFVQVDDRLIQREES